MVADDPLAHIDIPHMGRQEGFEILQTARNGHSVRLWRCGYGFAAEACGGRAIGPM